MKTGLTLLTLSVAMISTPSFSAESRLIRPQTETEAFPYIVSIQQKIHKNNADYYQHSCVGVLVGPDVVLTTENCVNEETDLDELQFAIGDSTLDTISADDIYYGRKAYTRDRTSDEPYSEDNITLIELTDRSDNTPVGLDFQDKSDPARVLSWDYSDLVFEYRVDSYGQGSYYTLDDVKTEQVSDLQSIDVTLSTHDECQTEYDYEGLTVPDEMTCILASDIEEISAINTDEGYGLQSACGSDRGAPVLVSRDGTYYLAAVDIVDNNCGEKGVPDMTTSIRSQQTWLETNLQALTDNDEAQYGNTEEEEDDSTSSGNDTGSAASTDTDGENNSSSDSSGSFSALLMLLATLTLISTRRRI